MPYVTVSISGGANDSRFGKSQFPIKSFIEKRGEGFEQSSVLKNLFRMDSSRNFGERYTGDTAMDDFEPVGEGGSYPQTGFEEAYAQILEHMTWKNRFVITREMVEDNKLGDMRKKAGKFMNAYHRTREKFGRELYVGGLSGTTTQIGGQTFKTAAADGLSLFHKEHPNKVNGEKQSNRFTGDFSAANLGKLETRMQNLTGDNGEILSVTPDTIWIPNEATIKNTVFAAIGADKDPETSNNAFNYQYGRWNVIVDPYLTQALKNHGVTYTPWFLLDSKFLIDQDGAVFLDRTKLDVRSVIDDNNDNNIWNGFARFTAGFVDWRFAAVGGVTGGTTL